MRHRCVCPVMDWKCPSKHHWHLWLEPERFMSNCTNQYFEKDVNTSAEFQIHSLGKRMWWLALRSQANDCYFIRKNPVFPLDESAFEGTRPYPLPGRKFVWIPDNHRTHPSIRTHSHKHIHTLKALTKQQKRREKQTAPCLGFKRDDEKVRLHSCKRSTHIINKSFGQKLS